MFSMNLGSGESRGYVVVMPRGELDLASAPAVAAALGVVAAREPRIIVDLAGLEFIDCSGAAALAHGREQSRRGGGDLLLVAPQQQVLRVLTIIRRANGPFVHASVEEAAASTEDPRRVTMPRLHRDPVLRQRHPGQRAPGCAFGRPGVHRFWRHSGATACGRRSAGRWLHWRYG
jgi:anti-sigma B factor antagonist